MYKISGVLFLFFLSGTAYNKTRYVTSEPLLFSDSIPAIMLGNFRDDYGIRYTITNTLWFQHPNTRYHIIRWNSKERFIIAKNDAGNSSDASLYTRIDYTIFTQLKPYEWGFCLSVYNAKSDSAARAGYAADKQNPRTGCNGFPFSRMKRAE